MWSYPPEIVGYMTVSSGHFFVLSTDLQLPACRIEMYGLSPDWTKTISYTSEFNVPKYYHDAIDHQIAEESHNIMTLIDPMAESSSVFRSSSAHTR